MESQQGRARACLGLDFDDGWHHRAVPTEVACIYVIFTKKGKGFLIFNLLILSLPLKKSTLGNLALKMPKELFL